jgi:hypothetical protein
VSAAHFRPQMRVPWYTAFGVFAVTYVAWAGLRGWDFRPDAFWIVVAIVLASLYGGRAWLAREIAQGAADEAAESGPTGTADGPEADAGPETAPAPTADTDPGSAPR